MNAGAAAGIGNVRGVLASPNDTIRVACVGLRGRGKDHINAYLKMPNVEIAAVCDIDETILNERAAMVASKAAKKPDAYFDFRRYLHGPRIVFQMARHHRPHARVRRGALPLRRR